MFLPKSTASVGIFRARGQHGFHLYVHSLAYASLHFYYPPFDAQRRNPSDDGMLIEFATQVRQSRSGPSAVVTRSVVARASLGILLGFLASCGRQPEKHPPTTPQKSISPSASQSDSSREPESPPAGLFFTGRWASEAANCRKASWTITEHELQTPGEVTCRFHRMTPTPRGAEVDATCTAEGPPQEWKLQFAYAQSARALLIENAPFADIGLVRCDDSDLPSDDTSSSAQAGGDAEFVSKGARGAADVLSKYYGLLDAGRFDDASRLWSPGNQSSEPSVADYESHEVHLGEPGRIEGAAGSLYISIPVQIHAKRNSGEEVQLSGEATLRRSNDVPGATPEQRSWRIVRIDLQPAAKG